MDNYDTVILDIEGTITPITFVKETLVMSTRHWFENWRLTCGQFPYVTSGLSAFLDRTWETDELKKQIELLREQVSRVHPKSS